MATIADIVTGSGCFAEGNTTSLAEVTAADEFVIAVVTVATRIHHHLVAVLIVVLAHLVGKGGRR